MASTAQYYQQSYHLQLVPSPHNYWLYGYIAGLGDIEDVFEFGCNAGRHLVELRRQGLKVCGIDISERAIEAAKIHNRLNTVRVGTGQALSQISTGRWDAVFTVSVLCHMPTPTQIIHQLRRITKKHLFLVETRSRNDHKNHWWKHDYPGDPIYEYYAGQLNAVYQIWHLRK
jgi:2-polyprenyl-3-methyl-5-hydroxy-6-metoxy-1,4-benzoquinol methylase